MATGARMERRERYQNQEIREKIPQEKPRHKRWTLRLGLFLIGLAVLAWFLPAIIVNTPILGWIVRKAAGGMKCSISIKSASLGWLSPITINGVAIRDEHNQALFEVEKISSDKSLLSILRNYTQLGAIPRGKARHLARLARGRQQRGRPAGEFQERNPGKKVVH